VTTAAISAEYDYVIVGGGSAGCVLAARLSASGSDRVLLIEAGSHDRSPFIRVPAGVKSITSRYDWCYPVEADASRGGVTENWASGKVIGGGSSVNAMLWVRGNRADFDRWAQDGAIGWDYENLLPYFVRSETFEDGARPRRGRGGPIHVSTVRVRHAVTDAFITSGAKSAFAANPDYNGDRQDGIAYSQVNQHRGWRSSTARAYLAPARRRRNLQVRLNTLAHRVVVEHGQAVGVEVEHNGAVTQIRATREVILAAGALATPRLLMLSGIGPAPDLRRHGIEVVTDRTGVGSNLQEHPLTVLLHRVNIRTLNRELTLSGVLKHGVDFAVRGRGAVSSPAVHAIAFGASPQADGASWFQAMFSPFGVVGKPSANKSGDDDGRMTHDVHAMKLLEHSSTTTYPCVLHPHTRGSLTLRSADPADLPLISHELLGDPRDVELLREAARLTRVVFDTDPLRSMVTEEMSPGAKVQSDTDWATYLRSHTFRSNHPVGTARMGSDDDAVVDPDLKVRGVDHLRVVDASVMPTLPSGNTNAATIAIAERASDLIRGRVGVGATHTDANASR
jgi:choline dehydrogenase